MVKKRDLNFIRDEECRKRIQRLMDHVQRAEYHGGVEATDFYDPYTVEIAVSLLAQEPGLAYAVSGGYEGAERKRIQFTFGDKTWLSDDEIVLFHGKTKGWTPKHPEILGSMMGLGLDRGKFGDIVIKEEEFFVFIIREVEGYVLSQLQAIGRERIEGCIVPIHEFSFVPEKGELKRISIASFRLDAIVSALVPTSRGRAQELIKRELVKINHRVEKRVAYEVTPGDLISIRGSGRFQLGTEWKESKKGRLHFEIEKF